MWHFRLGSLGIWNSELLVWCRLFGGEGSRNNGLSWIPLPQQVGNSLSCPQAKYKSVSALLAALGADAELKSKCGGVRALAVEK